MENKELKSTSGAPKGYFKRNSKTYVTISIFMLVTVGLVLFHQIKIQKLERQFESEKEYLTENFLSQKKEIITEVKQIVETSNLEHLNLMMKPLVWAVRTEMIKGNYDQVDLYIRQMVKEKNIKLVLIVDKDRKILLSFRQKTRGSGIWCSI